jgi:hypothetical protein
MKFPVNGFYCIEEMARTKIKYENKQKAVSQKLKSAEYWFLCTALQVIARSMHTKFGVNLTYSD